MDAEQLVRVIVRGPVGTVAVTPERLMGLATAAEIAACKGDVVSQAGTLRWVASRLRAYADGAGVAQ